MASHAQEKRLPSTRAHARSWSHASRDVRQNTYRSQQNSTSAQMIQELLKNPESPEMQQHLQNLRTSVENMPLYAVGQRQGQLTPRTEVAMGVLGLCPQQLVLKNEDEYTFRHDAMAFPVEKLYHYEDVQRNLQQLSEVHDKICQSGLLSKEKLVNVEAEKKMVEKQLAMQFNSTRKLKHHLKCRLRSISYKTRQQMERQQDWVARESKEQEKQQRLQSVAEQKTQNAMEKSKKNREKLENIMQREYEEAQQRLVQSLQWSMQNEATVKRRLLYKEKQQNGARIMNDVSSDMARQQLNEVEERNEQQTEQRRKAVLEDIKLAEKRADAELQKRVDLLAKRNSQREKKYQEHLAKVEEEQEKLKSAQRKKQEETEKRLSEWIKQKEDKMEVEKRRHTYHSEIIRTTRTMGSQRKLRVSLQRQMTKEERWQEGKAKEMRKERLQTVKYAVRRSRAEELAGKVQKAHIFRTGMLEKKLQEENEREKKAKVLHELLQQEHMWRSYKEQQEQRTMLHDMQDKVQSGDKETALQLLSQMRESVTSEMPTSVTQVLTRKLRLSGQKSLP